MELGIVGLPQSGKTTLFKALTGAQVEAFTDKAHIGEAPIPDPRLHTIAGYIKPKKIVNATIRLVDIPGVPVGSDAKKLNTVLEQIRQVQGLGHVVRCFDDGSGRVNPLEDIAKMDGELVLADLIVTENAKDKAARHARSGDADAKARVAFLEKITPWLEEEKPIRALEDLSDAERLLIRTYGFMSAKPVMYVANIAEDAVGDDGGPAADVATYAEEHGGTFVAVCAELEAELAELDDADRDEMLESLGLSEPAIGPLARAANTVLGLTTFYTAGEKEVRAWTTPIGSSAPVAAGAIHSDIQRGFIRAECFHVDDLVQYHSEKAIKEAGKLRSEGKGYQLQDGDVVHFLFNV
jgi:GTP-binding protein YchF